MIQARHVANIPVVQMVVAVMDARPESAALAVVVMDAVMTQTIVAE